MGAHVAGALDGAGFDVVAAVRPGSDPTRLARFAPRARTTALDVGAPLPDGLLDGVAVVCHLAATGVTSPATPGDLFASNIAGTHQLLEAARMARVRRFVHCGSCFEYPGGELLDEETDPVPASGYAISKVAATDLCRHAAARGQDVVVLRPFQVYGPGESPGRLVASTISACMEDRELELTDGLQRRDLVHVRDVARAFVLAAEAEALPSGSVLNVSTGVATPVRDVVTATVDAVGGGRPRFGALPRRHGEVEVQTGDPTLAGRLLGWRAEIGLAQGIADTVRWHVDQREAVGR